MIDDIRILFSIRLVVGYVILFDSTAKEIN